MIANANDDGTNGGPEGLAVWVVERCEGGGFCERLHELRGPIHFGAVVPVPPELWGRCKPLDDDEKEGA